MFEELGVITRVVYFDESKRGQFDVEYIVILIILQYWVLSQNQ